MNPLVNIFVTSYNHEKYIKKCIDSLINQTYSNLIINVVDDCSTDESINILRSYGDDIILKVRKKNLGQENHGKTLNEAIDASTGKFFYRIDSDDYIELDYIENMIKAWKQDNSLDWICGGLNLIDENNNITGVWDYSGWPTKKRDILKHAFSSCSVCMPHNGIVSLNFLKENNLRWEPFDYGWGGDVLFTIRAAMCSPNIKYLRKPGFNWRIHGENNSSNIKWRMNLFPATKKYFAENIMIDKNITVDFLKHALLVNSETDEDFEACKYYLLAIDLLKARNNFVVPNIIKVDNIKKQVEDNIDIFNDAIRDFCYESMKHSPRFIDRLGGLLSRL